MNVKLEKFFLEMVNWKQIHLYYLHSIMNRDRNDRKSLSSLDLRDLSNKDGFVQSNFRDTFSPITIEFLFIGS